ADRAEFVRQLLAQVGISKPDTSHWIVRPVEPGDQSAPPRDHLIMSAIAQRTAWRAEYTRAPRAAGPTAAQRSSAIPIAAEQGVVSGGLQSRCGRRTVRR